MSKGNGKGWYLSQKGKNEIFYKIIRKKGKNTNMKTKVDVLKELYFKKARKNTKKTTVATILEDITQEIDSVSSNSIPKVFFTGDLTGINKSNTVNLGVVYKSSNLNFEDTCTLKWQGTSSLNYPKKNFTIKLKKAVDCGWGIQKKYCLKANFIDHSHARNVVSAQLWSDIVASRENYNSIPELLKSSPNHGAIDGYPFKLYINGVYEGLYTWNIPKDAWMFNMDSSLDNHCVLCGENYESGCFRDSAIIDGSDWSDEVHDVVPTIILTRWNEIIDFVMNSKDQDFKAKIDSYIDLESLIDYYLFAYFSCGLDSMGKNQIYCTFNGTKWYASMYDMDSTFGLYWNGQSFVSPEYRCQEDFESMQGSNKGNLLYLRLLQNFKIEIWNRYLELKEGALSLANVIYKFEKFMDKIQPELYLEDLTIYNTIPSGTTNNIQQIRRFITERANYVDGKLYTETNPIKLSDFEISIAGRVTVGKTNNLAINLFPSNANNYSFTYASSDDTILTINESGEITGIAEGAATVTCIDTVTQISKDLEVTVYPSAGLEDHLVMQLNGDSVQSDGTLTENIIGITTDTSNTYLNTPVTNGDYIRFKENVSNIPFKSVIDEGDNAIDMETSRNAFFIHSSTLDSALPKEASKTIAIDFKNKIQDGVTDKLNLYLGNSVTSENFASVNNWGDSTTIYVTQDKLRVERGQSIKTIDVVSETRYKLVLVLDASKEGLNGTLNIYLDGNLISQTDYVKEDVKNGVLNIGNTESAIMFKGYLYELAVYNKALKQEEIETL